MKEALTNHLSNSLEAYRAKKEAESMSSNDNQMISRLESTHQEGLISHQSIIHADDDLRLPSLSQLGYSVNSNSKTILKPEHADDLDRM